MKPINFRPHKLEDLILEKLQLEYLENASKSEVVRYCIRVAGEHLINENDYLQLVLNSTRKDNLT